MPQESALEPLLQADLIRVWPERTRLSVSGLTCLNNGWESDVYAFTAYWEQEQREELILRIYPGADAYSKAAFEYNNLLPHTPGKPS